MEKDQGMDFERARKDGRGILTPIGVDDNMVLHHDTLVPKTAGQNRQAIFLTSKKIWVELPFADIDEPA